jgi:NAD(P)-dependent dehydrogenase (short-subunit alcohol dehydrogenase family)
MTDTPADDHLAQRVALVTGGGSGIGAATVEVLLREGARVMAGRGGSIDNVSSVAGMIGMPLTGAYGPSPAGVRLLTRSAALEGAHRSPPVRVNAVHPGCIATPMTGGLADTLGESRLARLARRVRGSVPLEHMGAPRDIAGAIAFLAGGRSRFTSGSSLVVDGGWTSH